MPFVSRGLALAALLVAAPHPTFAASAATQALLDNLIPNVDFLDRSSRLALDHARAPRVKAFARAEAREQTAAIDALYGWTRGPALARPALVALAGAPTPAAKALDATPTGSVATPWPPHAGAPDPADTRLPRGQEDLDSLDGLDGAAFDADLKTKQADALAQIETDYATYLAKGDDPALLTLATGELPRVRAAIAALKRL